MRLKRTATDLQRVADDLRSAADSLADAIKKMEEAGMPFATIHATTVYSRYLPALVEWSNRTKGEVQSQVFAFREEQARAEQEREQKGQKSRKK